jgi:hypothetical protein
VAAGPREDMSPQGFELGQSTLQRARTLTECMARFRSPACRREDSNLGRPVPAVLSRFPLTAWVRRHVKRDRESCAGTLAGMPPPEDSRESSEPCFTSLSRTPGVEPN